MNEQKKSGPFLYCDKDLKNKPTMVRWRSRLTNGKDVTVTVARRTKLPTVKEFDQKIKEIEDRIEENEIAHEKRTITATVYEDTRRVAIQELQFAKRDREVRGRLNYLGQQEQFLGYESDGVKRDIPG